MQLWVNFLHLFDFISLKNLRKFKFLISTHTDEEKRHRGIDKPLTANIDSYYCLVLKCFVTHTKDQITIELRGKEVIITM